MVKKGVSDPHLSQAFRLSLVQRARRILQSRTLRNKKSSGAEDGGIGTYSLEDFPEEDVLHAVEV